MSNTRTYTINGRVVRELRASWGLTQEQLAAECKVTRQWISVIELKDRTEVSGSVFLALTRSLQVQDRRSLLAEPLAGAEGEEIAGAA